MSPTSNASSVAEGRAATRSSRAVRLTLGALIAIDVALALLGLAAPSMWYRFFHGTAAPPDLLFLRRTGAQWAGFALVQLLALIRFERRPAWLAAVAGVRLGDVFTDVAYLVGMHSRTPIAWIGLLIASPANLLLAWLLFHWASLAGEGAAAPRIAQEGSRKDRTKTRRLRRRSDR